MDLKNLISRTSDDENSENKTTPEAQLSKRPSQPRLSIHSLMNGNDNSTVVASLPTGGETAVRPPASSVAEEVPQVAAKDNGVASLPTDASQPSVGRPEDPDTLNGAKDGEPKSSTTATPNSSESDRKAEPDLATTGCSSTILTSETDPAKTTATPAGDLPEKHEETATMANTATKSKTPNSKVQIDMKLHDQIQHLEQLKQKEEIDDVPAEGKPKRYRTKPTWAQDFIPTVNHSRSTGFTEARTLKSNITGTNISKLEIPSITGSIPRNDFNKLVTEWIWANIEGIKQDYSDVPNVENCIELELKFGNVWDKVKDSRIQLPINTECVVATDYVNQECFFKPGITVENFNDTKAYMNKLIQEALESQQQGRGNANNKFVLENSHVVDLIASDSRRNDKPISGRVSLDIKTKRKTNSITKQRISDLYLHFPNTLFDLRLTLSVELPNELNDAAFEIFKKRVTMEREKERISYIHQATFTRIDLTKVREKNSRVPKYELELEINTPALLRSMNNVMDDPLYYIDLVQAFLDNGRIITRHLSNQRQ